MTRFWPRSVLVVASFFVATSPACDCEDRIRRWISDPGNRTGAAVRDTGVESSRPSEREPNNSAEDASPVGLGGEIRPVDGRVKMPEDVDWFALSVDESEPWTVEMTVQPEPELDVVVLVELSEDAVPTEYDLGGAGEAEKLPALRVSEAPLRFAVASKDATTGSYTLRFKRRLAGASIEAEPNDEPDAAVKLTVPGEIQGYYDRPDDRDVFRLEGLRGEPMSLQVTSAGELKQIVRVFDDPSFREPLLSFQVVRETMTIPSFALPEAESSERIPGAEPVEPRPLFVVLTTVSGFDRDHPYRVRFQPLPSEDPLELEPNDRVPQEIGPTVTLSGFLHGPDDVDRFVAKHPEEDDAESEEAESEEADAGSEPPRRLDEAADAGAAPDPSPLDRLPEKQPADELMRVVLKPGTEELQLGLEFSTERGPDTIKASAPGEPVESCGRPLGDGVAFSVRALEAPDNRTGRPDYELDVSTVAASDFEIEPNDDRDRADRLEESRRGYAGGEADPDVYGFGVEVAPMMRTRHVSLDVSGPEADYRLRLLDEDGGLVADTDNAGPGAGERLALDLPAGLYFVEVRAMGRGSCKPYDLKVSAR